MSPLRERLRLAVEIAARWWRGRSRSSGGDGRGSVSLVSGTARAAFFSAALGTLAMTVAMSLLTGYREVLVDRLVGANAAIVVYPLASEGAGFLPRTQLDRLTELPGVTAVERVAFGQGTLSAHSPGSSSGSPAELVTVRGGEPGETILGEGTPRLPPRAAQRGPSEPPPVLLGDELAKALDVGVGDLVRWTALGFGGGRPHFSYQSLRVVGTFHVGFSEFDRSWAVTDREVVVARLGASGTAADPEAAAGMIELRLADARRAPELAGQVQRIVGDSYLVTEWQALNDRLFGALRLQQRMLFLVLALIVVVSTFHVASTLIVAARERTREIGILRTLGFEPGDVRRTFLIHGLVLGWAGATAGVVTGAAIAWLLDSTRAIRFDPGVAAIYFLESVPFHLRAVDLAAVLGFAFAVHAVACWAPTRRAVRLPPAAALRDE